MKGRWLLVAVWGALVLAGYSPGRADGWKEVDEAVARGLPRTAIEAIDPIIEDALSRKAYDEAARGMARRVVLQGMIEGDRPEERIVRMETAIDDAPEEMRPILHALLAHWYWQYFQQNRWRFVQRTMTGEEPGEDFATWDLPRLLGEIDRQFARALEAEEFLKATPVARWDALLKKGTIPDRYRPTLYDFIAQEALSFYTSGEQAGARPQDDFEVTDASPVFDAAEVFLEWESPVNAEGSAKARAIRLYQELLRFHHDDREPAAFADVDLGRLVFGKNAAVGEKRGERFIQAVEAFVKDWSDHEIAAMGLYQLARAHQSEGNLSTAHALAGRAVGRYPESPGAKQAENLIQEIESKSAAISAERVWNDPWPRIEVRYRNVERVYFRAVPYEWEDLLHERGQAERLSREQRQTLLETPPAATWDHRLPPTEDFQERAEAVGVLATLAPGFYMIVASHDPAFREEDNQISVAPVWVSELAMMVRSRADRLEGLVVDARSGEPVAGAKVELFEIAHREPIVRPRVPLVTDGRGFFSADGTSSSQNFAVRATSRGRQIASAPEAYYNHGTDSGDREHAVLFTDRAIYRPGQQIQYKAILLRTDLRRSDYDVVAGRKVTVVFYDANGQEIAKQERLSNDYGSIAGSFTAPRDRLTGAMRIAVPGHNGSVHLRVEEYKRPRFLVTLDPRAEGPRLDKKVTVPGKALSYTGAPVDGAEVRYRVYREVRWPWWGRGFHPHGSESQEIANGTVRTGVDGSFQITFLALPDRAIPEEKEPIFVFRVEADVTDGAGETRSAQRRISVGYTALQVVLATEHWLTTETPVTIDVSTTSLDGEPERAEGVVRIHALQEPESVQRPAAHEYSGGWQQPYSRGNDDPTGPNSWPLGEVVVGREFSTREDGKAKIGFSLSAGVYRAVVETTDRFGKKVTAPLTVHVLDPAGTTFPTPVPFFFAVESQTLEPGQTFRALWGTGYERGRAFVEIEHRRNIIRSYWTAEDRTQELIEFDVTEELRGGFTVHVTYFRENRAYMRSHRIDVPWTNKQLKVRWEHFTSKLEPNQKETWTAVITGPEGDRAAAEMAATLYDASLDSFVRHHWIQRLPGFYYDSSTAQPRFANYRVAFERYHWNWHVRYPHPAQRYRSFPDELVGHHGLLETRLGAVPSSSGFHTLHLEERLSFDMDASGGAPARRMSGAGMGGELAVEQAPDLEVVAARRNLQETAFFFPQLTVDENGEVRMTFTMPEALTEWRFMGFVHDRGQRSGFIEGTAVTSKELMVQPNAPRFVREGDTIEFTVKVTNRSEAPQRGKVRVSFRDALTEEAADEALGNLAPEQTFEIPAGESRTYSWKLTVPDGLAILSYRAVAASAAVSDGEEGYLPVLSRRVLVRESMPLPIRGPGEKSFTFEKLARSGGSQTLEQTLEHQSVTVQMVSNPAWYAVLALPYLMEFPHECTEQTFNRFYANALARHIADSNPKIRRVFDLWKNTPALESPLEKNEQLKGVVLEETPWVRQARSESQARRDVGILFDENRLNYEAERTSHKLADAQMTDGAWPWFPGGPANDFITLYITTGFGRMRHLGVDVPMEAPLRSLSRLDQWVDRTYREIKDEDRHLNHLSPMIALYLYGRSFFLDDRPVGEEHREAVDYFLGQGENHWLALHDRQSQGHLALALHRFGDDRTPRAIMDSLRERAVRDGEMGMFWRDREFSWWWYRAPIETQALMIEAFSEITEDAEAVEECKVWLLKQKQTQDWKTTKATADAVYALLLRGENLLASDEPVEVFLGEDDDLRDITPRRGSAGGAPEVEAGTGFYEVRFTGGDVRPDHGHVTVRKVDDGVAWGGIHWEYLEDISKITPHEATPLKLRKRVFVKKATERGPVLEAVKGPVEVGDELVVRIELRSDRDMEYLHLKDQRGSGLEPLNVLSRYRYQDGLAYYEVTRDTASHFFIDYLPKGIYVFEYSTRVFHRGRYPTGIAEIQSMYAPEFSSHSESIQLEAR